MWEMINLIASCLEVVGALLIGNAYLNVLPHQVPGMMVSALWRGAKAENCVPIAELIGERRIVTLQGLAFIALGFMLKSIHSVVVLLGNVG